MTAIESYYKFNGIELQGGENALTLNTSISDASQDDIKQIKMLLCKTSNWGLSDGTAQQVAENDIIFKLYNDKIAIEGLFSNLRKFKKLNNKVFSVIDKPMYDTAKEFFRKNNIPQPLNTDSMYVYAGDSMAIDIITQLGFVPLLNNKLDEINNKIDEYKGEKSNIVKEYDYVIKFNNENTTKSMKFIEKKMITGPITGVGLYKHSMSMFGGNQTQKHRRKITKRRQLRNHKNTIHKQVRHNTTRHI